MLSSECGPCTRNYEVSLYISCKKKLHHKPALKGPSGLLYSMQYAWACRLFLYDTSHICITSHTCAMKERSCHFSVNLDLFQPK